MKPTVIFLHGFPQDAALWRPQVAHFSVAHRVLAPDLRGFGADQRPIPAALTMEHLAADVLALMDAEAIDRAVLCGLSMGGYVALAFAEQWPQRLAGLALCNTRAAADTAEGRAAREQTARDALAKGAEVIARVMLPWILSERTRREHPAIAERMLAMMARQRPEAIAAAARGMALRPDRYALLGSIAAPTLIITGSDDALMPLPTSEAMHAAIPHCRMVVIDGAGHISNQEAPGLFNAELELFLDELC
jgi:pimeloyl-ACP methyl ester carboxylesterase